ncbi:MAG: CopD family protein, partial [Pseudomonadota bacterium]|nr:CopD family protein [Pseudomonadota bacterium]
WVWGSVIAILGTGLWLMALRGWFAGSGVYIHAMLGIGLVMAAIYAVIFFGPYRRLKASVARQAWPAGAEALARIRLLVTVNLVLGLLTIVIATGFKAW